MKKIALPVLDGTPPPSPRLSGLYTASRVRAVVTRSGDACRLHEDSDLAEAIERTKGPRLAADQRRRIVALGPQSSEWRFAEEFLQRNQGEHLVSAAIGQGPAGEFMHFFCAPRELTRWR